MSIPTLLSEDDLKAVTKRYSTPIRQHLPWSSLSASLLSSVIDTAASPDVSGTCTAAAATALYTFLQRQNHESFKSYLWGQGIWLRCFDVYLSKADSIKGKSMRNLLAVLASLLHHVAGFPETKKIVLQRVLHILQSASDRTKVKAALKALGILCSKHVIPIDILVQHFNKSSVIPRTEPDIEAYQNLFRTILRWVVFPELALAASQASVTVWRLCHTELQLQTKMLGNAYSNVWVFPVLEILKHSPESLSQFKLHLFPKIFQDLTLEEYFNFLKQVQSQDHVCQSGGIQNSAVGLSLYLIAMQVGKETGLVQESEASKSGTTSGLSFVENDTIFVNSHELYSFLLSPSPPTRLAALSLAISSSTRTKPFFHSLRVLKKALPLLFSETDAGVRGEMLTLMGRLLVRLQAVTARLEHVVCGSESSRTSFSDPAKHTGSDDAGQEKHSSSKMNGSRDLASITRVAVIENAKRIAIRHLRFAKWLVEYSIAQLKHESGYQRQVFALKVLSMTIRPTSLDKSARDELIDQNSWWHQYVIQSHSKLRPLLADLTMNPFEDIRSLSASLLEQTFPDPSRTDDEIKWMLSTVTHAENRMVQTGRADHADGFARFYSLLWKRTPILHSENSDVWYESRTGVIDQILVKLDYALQKARLNMDEAISSLPLHGMILALRYMLEDPSFYHKLEHEITLNNFGLWKLIYNRILLCLDSVWLVVKNVLCNDAPEGHVPDDLQDDSSLTTKDILSYSWRALKESSGLIKVIALQTPRAAKNGNYVYLSEREFDGLSQLSFTALIELRHRGAFSAVAMAFAACCQRGVKDSRHSSLENVYVHTLQSIQDRGSTITRRSAGIPSLMTGILTADPDGSLFIRAMNVLQKLASAPGQAPYDSSLPQVHALNCLKAIFTNAHLGPSSEKYLAEGLELSGRCLTSEMWAIRNCGLMLFRSLIDRMLGSAESQNWTDFRHCSISRVTWAEIPALETIILRLLNQPLATLDTPSAGVESVFLALKIIQRIPPPAGFRDQVSSRVLTFCDSSHWHVRDMAARTFSVLLPPSGCNLAELIQVLLTGTDIVRQNSLHGRLLCIVNVLKFAEAVNVAELQDSFHEIAALFGNSYDDPSSFTNLVLVQNSNPFTKAAFLEILNFMNWLVLTDRIQSGSYKFVGEDLLEHLVVEGKSTSSVRRAAFNCRVLSIEDSNWLQGSLQEFSEQDPNTCAWIFTDLLPMVQWFPSKKISAIATAAMKVYLHASVASTAAQDLLIRIIDVGKCPTLELDSSSLRQMFLGSRAISPSQMESGILLWSQLAGRSTMKNDSKEYLQEVFLLLRNIRPLIHELMPFSIRLQAVKALDHVPHICSHSPSTNSKVKNLLKLNYLLLLYDALNDDDEEIRDLAAEIAHRVFLQSDSSCTPMIPTATSVKLAVMLPRIFNCSSPLCKEAIKRMTTSTSLDSETGLRPTAADRFAAADVESTELFVVEKQNLFRDVIRESDIWSVILYRSSPSPQQLKMLENWAIEGLNLVTSNLNNRDKGCIGWVSKPEVFAFIWQLINAGDAVLHFSGSASVTTLLKLLATLIKEIEHPMLSVKVEKILERRVIRRLRDSYEMLQDLLQRRSCG